MTKLPVLLLVVVLMTVTAGCRPRTVGRVHDSNIVSIKEIQPGDRIAGLLVASMEYVDDHDFAVLFTGRLRLSGSFIHNLPDDYVAGVVFFADEKSLQKLPRFIEDTRDPGAFTLDQPAKFAPPGSRGTATVIVDQYRLVHRQMGAMNSARLVRLVQKGP